MVTWVHVNQHIIRANKQTGADDPVITVKQGKKNTYCRRVAILGPSEVIYSGNDQTLLPCGARVAVRTEGEVKILS
jgi:hypothetical protein